MPILGQGIIPGGATGQEVQYVTRRAFVPKMVVQIYNSSPLAAAFLGNSQPATGGVSSVTVPVQGQSFVNAQWTDYSGSFNQPAIQNGVQNAEFNLKALVVPIPMLGMESAVQKGHAIINLLEARMNDSTNVAVDAISSALYGNAYSNTQLVGLPGAIDDGTNAVNYGGINRNTSPFWKAKVVSNGSPISPTRALVMQYITGVVKSSGEIPAFGVMGPGTWQALANDFIGQESFQIQPGTGFDGGTGPRSGFRALMVAGVPIYLDVYCPEGTLYLLNNNYGAFYIHEDAAFAFTGFQSTLPNMQIGYIGAVLALMELVVTKPKANGAVTGLSYINL